MSYARTPRLADGGLAAHPGAERQTRRPPFYLDIEVRFLDHVTLYVMATAPVLTQQSGAQVAPWLRPYLATTLVLPFDLAASAAASALFASSRMG